MEAGLARQPQYAQQPEFGAILLDLPIKSSMKMLEFWDATEDPSKRE